MNRLAVLITTLVALVIATTVVWMEVRQEREFRRLIAEGDAALDAKRTSEAIEAFSGALAFKPGSMLAHLQRAEAYRRGERDLAAALRDAGEASSLDPTAPQPIELLGDISAAMGRYDQAIDHYDRYLQLDDRSTRVLYKVALAYVRQEQAVRGIEPLRRAIGLDDQFAEAHYLLGLALRDGGNNDQALTELRRAIALDAALIPAREELADLYLSRGGHVREAVDQLEAIAALEPSRPERVVDVASALARNGQREAALLTLNRAAERHPGSSVLLAALGRIWLEMAAAEDDSSAVRQAIAALQPQARRPDATSEVLTLLGEAQLRAGNVADAERTLQQAVTRQPVMALAYRHLAEAARRRGHSATARDAEARYSRLVPGV
jgi:tetratricopeptide (TPR) repeat protein